MVTENERRLLDRIKELADQCNEVYAMLKKYSDENVALRKIIQNLPIEYLNKIIE